MVSYVRIPWQAERGGVEGMIIKYLIRITNIFYGVNNDKSVVV